MKIYLSSGFYKGYKQQIKPLLEAAGFELIDPELKPKELNVGGYVAWDLQAIRDSGLVLAIQDDYPYIYGTAAEIGYAVALEKPVIYVCLTDRVDGFLSGCARATFTNLEAATKFIVERYKP